MCTAIATVFRFTYFQISGWNSIKNLLKSLKYVSCCMEY